MDTAREDRIERLFEEASTLPHERRAAFLDRACGSDTELRAALDGLVTHAAKAHEFVDRVAGPAMARAMGEVMRDPCGAEKRGPDPFIGQEVDHFRILEKLGGGGMGRVYKALDLKLDRTVALKFLPPHLGTDDEAKRRLIHEAKAASALDHPNICAIYEIGETDAGRLFIAMAHYEGETLKAKIARGPLPVGEALRYGAQIAEALQRAHTSGIVHRDIKPSNVMVTAHGEVKVLDFGLAKTAGSDLTREGATIGTVAYMSPEQTHGNATDARTDVWSLGAVLYEMLTGERPFRSENDQTLIHAIRHDAPKPVRELRPEVSAHVAALVSRCLEKSPTSRCQSAAELLAGVHGVQAVGSSVRRPAWQIRVLVYTSVAVLLGLMLLIGNRRITPPETRVASLAVLPVAPSMGDSAEQYFADGMTDLLIAQLSQFSGLQRVISRSSVMQYKDTRKSSRQIGQELGVDALVEMSVLRAGDQVRITVNLVEAGAQRVLWGDSFERPLRDVLTLQREVAQAIRRQLQVQLTPQEAARLSAPARRVDPEAFALYLQAVRVSGPDQERERIAYLEQALEKDSAFALAYARVALSYTMVARDRAKAEWAIARALALDPSLSEAHDALGLLRMWLDWDWIGAQAALHRAIALSPHNSRAHHELGQLLMRLGRCDEAVVAEQTAVLHDPARQLFQSGLGEIYLYCRRYDEAVHEFERTLGLTPNSSYTYRNLGDAYFYQRQYPKALAMYEKAGSVPGWARIPLGSRKEALRQIAELKSALPHDGRWDLARLYTSLGEPDSAITWLEQAYEHRDGMVVYLRVMPHFDPLRDHPRFQTLLKKVGLAR